MIEQLLSLKAMFASLRVVIAFSLLLYSASIFAQEPPKFIKEKIAFCDSSMSEAQAIRFRRALNELENNFIEEGLLANNTGASYRAVYQQIADTGDLNFEIERRIGFLDSLSTEVISGCFYKVLTTAEIAQLKPRHQKAAERITAPVDDVNPALIAQRIVDNITLEDFNLEFYQVSSLLTFYQIASPKALDLTISELSKEADPDLETIKIFVNDQDEIEINGKTSSLDAAEELIYQFIAAKPHDRGVEFSAASGAAYQTFLEANEMLNAVYTDLKEAFGDIPKNIIFKR